MGDCVYKKPLGTAVIVYLASDASITPDGRHHSVDRMDVLTSCSYILWKIHSLGTQTAWPQLPRLRFDGQSRLSQPWHCNQPGSFS